MTPESLRNDQEWLIEFRKFTNGIDVYSNAFLEKAHLGTLIS
jgi:hypothetical protein